MGIYRGKQSCLVGARDINVDMSSWMRLPLLIGDIVYQRNNVTFR